MFSGLARDTQEKFESAALFLRSTLICNENRAFRKRASKPVEFDIAGFFVILYGRKTIWKRSYSKTIALQ